MIQMMADVKNITQWCDLMGMPDCEKSKFYMTTSNKND